MIRPAFHPISPRRAWLIAHAATWGPLLALLFLAGCATAPPGPPGPFTFQKGQVATGVYLVTLTTSPMPVAHVGARDVALPGGQIARTIQMTLPQYLIESPWTSPRGNDAHRLYEVIAHEVCHAVAMAQGLTDGADPCHREDGGQAGGRTR